MTLFKILLIIMFFVVVYALGSACYNLVSKKGSGEKLFRSLAWRIGLSVCLFALIVTGIQMGWIKPNDPFAKNRTAQKNK